MTSNVSCFIIEGKQPLFGNVYLSGSKNASLPLMACALLTKHNLSLTNIPIIDDIFNMRLLLEHIGVTIDSSIVEHNNNKCLKLNMNCKNILNTSAPRHIFSKIRASLYILGALLTRFGKCSLPMPGGCFGEKRPIDLHLKVLEAMGAKIELKNDGYLYATTNNKRLNGVHFIFEKKSVGATANAILAAILAIGETYLENCAREPEIVELCNCLCLMGAEIYDAGEDNIRIVGKQQLHGTNYTVMSDRMEAGTFMVAAALTESELTINGIDYKIVENFGQKLIEANVEIKQLNESSFIVKNNSMKNLKPIDIITNPHPYPVPTDIQPLFMVLMTLINGSSTITENIFESRFSILNDLKSMGANLKLTDNKNEALIIGVDSLHASKVYGSDLRACAALVLAGLVANGTTIVYGIENLDRGYFKLEDKLINCGAKITRKIEPFKSIVLN